MRKTRLAPRDSRRQVGDPPRPIRVPGVLPEGADRRGILDGRGLRPRNLDFYDGIGDDVVATTTAADRDAEEHACWKELQDSWSSPPMPAPSRLTDVRSYDDAAGRASRQSCNPEPPPADAQASLAPEEVWLRVMNNAWPTDRFEIVLADYSASTPGSRTGANSRPWFGLSTPSTLPPFARTIGRSRMVTKRRVRLRRLRWDLRRSGG